MLGTQRLPAILVGSGYLAIGAAAWAASEVGPGQAASGIAAGGSMLTLWAASGLFAALALLARDRTGSWLTVAVVGPLALQPLTLGGSDGAAALLGVLWPASLVPLAFMLAQGRTIRLLVIATAVAAVVIGVALVVAEVGGAPNVSIVRYLVGMAIVALPAIARSTSTPTDLSTAEIAERGEIVVACVAPALAGLVLVTPWEVGVAALLVASACLLAGTRIAVRPLTWVVARTRAQRDLAIAISEAERKRLAADLHDGPLQDVLLLARRLDATGDIEGAALARAIGGELRELSGDLRLPLLDDLGVGPALEWLAGRVRGMTAADVQVAFTSDGRVPAAVELAAFRIAQEAITNAVRHGAPPVLVRCRTAPNALSLSVEDAGQGLAQARPQAGSRPAPFGLLNMQQRAEQVGAHLEWRQAHAGGTLVALEWRATS